MERKMLTRRSLFAVAALVLSLVPCAWGAGDTGVRVNHLVLGPTTSAGGQSPWSYSKGVLTLTGENTDYILSGKNLNGDVRVEVKANCLVTLEDFELDVSSKSGQNAIAVRGNHTLTLNLVGTSRLQGAARGCGVLVLPGNKLIVQSETGTGLLEAKGGTAAAGIGGEYYSSDGSGTVAIIGGSCGEVTVLSGNVVAMGGVGGAGIGGGGSYTTGPLAVGGKGGTVRVFGGNVVAFGGSGGAGIGGGQGIGYAQFEWDDDFEIKGGDGGTVDIYGGNVTVRGGSGAAAIGGGQNGRGGTLRIHDGTVGFLTGGARDVGAGNWERATQLADNGTYQILGGSVSSSQTDFRPKNPAGLELYPLSVPWPVRNATPILSDLTVDGKYYGYTISKGTTGDESAYFIWLPSGEVQFAVGGAWYGATVRASGTALTKVETTFNALGGRIVYAGKNDMSLTLGTYKPGVAYGQLPAGTNVSRSGYEFGGWYDNQGRRVVDTDIVPSGSRTLTAKWLTPLDRGVAVGNSELKFTAYRNRPELTTCTWFGQSEVGYSNGNALRSGTIGHDATNVLQCVVTGPGTVSFRYRVSSENDYDELRFHIASAPNRPLLDASGDTGTSWKLFTGEVPAGQQTLVWTYRKDFSRSVGEDCAYLDDICFTPTPATYAIRFVRNDGSGASVTRNFPHGVTTSLPSLAALAWARSGMDFKGWATSASNAAAGKVWKTDGAAVATPTAANTTMDAFAVWSLKSGYYGITFNKNDGSGTWRSAAYKYGENTTLPSCGAGLGWTREGYVFKGWSLSANGAVWKGDRGVVATGIPAGTTKSVYAIWEKNVPTYTIRFIKNDGAGTLVTQDFPYNVTTKLPTLAALGWPRNGLDFLGWATSSANASAGKIWKTDGAAVAAPTAAGKTMDAIAVWQLKEGYYQIKYQKNDGSGKWRSAAYKYGVNSTLASCEVGLGWTREGYVFKGWSLTPDGAVWKGDRGVVATGIPAGTTRNVYAIWQSVSACVVKPLPRSVASASAGQEAVFVPETVSRTQRFFGYLDGEAGAYAVIVEDDVAYAELVYADGLAAYYVGVAYVGDAEIVFLAGDGETFSFAR